MRSSHRLGDTNSKRSAPNNNDNNNNNNNKNLIFIKLFWKLEVSNRYHFRITIYNFLSPSTQKKRLKNITNHRPAPADWMHICHLKPRDVPSVAWDLRGDFRVMNQGPPRTWEPPYRRLPILVPYYSHTIPISWGILMGVV